MRRALLPAAAAAAAAGHARPGAAGALVVQRPCR
eukprot:SAG22_NODE_11854_length_466_cov_1.234332_1_plen_33_part_10